MPCKPQKPNQLQLTMHCPKEGMDKNYCQSVGKEKVIVKPHP